MPLDLASRSTVQGIDHDPSLGDRTVGTASRARRADRQHRRDRDRSPGLAGCGPPGSPAASRPISRRRRQGQPATKEADLATVTLTPDAETRLGLGPAEVDRKPVPRTTTYGGVIEVPSGGQITVASPFNGVLNAPQRDGRPRRRAIRSSRGSRSSFWCRS